MRTLLRSALSIGVAAAVLFAYAPIVSAAVVINEVMWMGSDVSTADEWVELLREAQPGESDVVSLKGWTLTTLSSAGAETIMTTFGPEALLRAGDVLIVANDHESTSRLGFEPAVVTADVSLPNTKLLLRLRDANGVIVDEADDGVGNPFAGSNPSGSSGKASMERFDPLVSGTDPANWRTATVSDGFDDGAAIFGTPGAPNSVTPIRASSLPSSVSITEPSSASGMPSSSSESSVSTVLESSVSSLLPSSSSEPLSSSVSSSPVPESSSTSSSSSSIDSSLSSALPSETSHVASLPSTQESSASSVPSAPPSSVSSTSSVPSAPPSPPPSTARTPIPRVRITEVLADPEGSDTNEWVELTNADWDVVDLSGWTLYAEGSSSSYSFPVNVAPILEPGGALALRKALTGLSLDNDGATLILRSPQGSVDSLTYARNAEGVSVGRDKADPNRVMAFCVPTEGRPNDALLPDPRIEVQSRSVSANGSVSLNLQAAVGGGLLSSSQCSWSFGDGHGSDSCNPPSHTFSEAGTRTVVLRWTSYCGSTVERFLAVEVVRSSSSSSSVLSSSSSRLATQEEPEEKPCSPTVIAGLRLKTFLPNPLPGGEESVEVENTTAVSLPLCGWSLDDEEGGSRAFALDHLTLSPRSTLRLTSADTGIRFNDGGDQVRLFGPGSPAVLLEDIAYENAKDGERFTRQADGTFRSDHEEEEEPEGADREETDASSSVVIPSDDHWTIAAVMPHPESGGVEWIDLVADEGEGSRIDGWTLETSADDPVLLSAMVADGRGILRISAKGSGLRLRDTDGVLVLRDPEGVIRSSVAWKSAKVGETYRPIAGVDAMDGEGNIVSTAVQKPVTRSSVRSSGRAPVVRPGLTVAPSGGSGAEIGASVLPLPPPSSLGFSWKVPSWAVAGILFATAAVLGAVAVWKKPLVAE